MRTVVRGKGASIEEVSRRVEEEIRTNNLDSAFGAENNVKYQRKCVQYFTERYGKDSIKDFELRQMQEYKQWLSQQEWSTSTKNHYLFAAKRIFKYGVSHGLCHQNGIVAMKGFRVGKKPDRSYSDSVLSEMFLKMHRDLLRSRTPGNSGCSQCYWWAKLQYMTCARPAELWRFINGEGEWIEDGVFELTESKSMEYFPRVLLFNATALAIVEEVQPKFKNYTTYGSMVKYRSGQAAHYLRHTSTQHLVKAGVHPVDIPIILGHYNKLFKQADAGYFNPDWQRYRAHMSHLETFVFPE